MKLREVDVSGTESVPVPKVHRDCKELKLLSCLFQFVKLRASETNWTTVEKPKTKNTEF